MKASYAELARQALNKSVTCDSTAWFEREVSGWKGIHCFEFRQTSTNWAGTSGVIEVAFRANDPRKTLGKWAFAIDGTFWFSISENSWETASGHDLRRIFQALRRDPAFSAALSDAARLPGQDVLR